jgi:hypothetical protein
VSHHACPSPSPVQFLSPLAFLIHVVPEHVFLSNSQTLLLPAPSCPVHWFSVWLSTPMASTTQWFLPPLIIQTELSLLKTKNQQSFLAVLIPCSVVTRWWLSSSLPPCVLCFWLGSNHSEFSLSFFSVLPVCCLKLLAHVL